MTPEPLTEGNHIVVLSPPNGITTEQWEKLSTDIWEAFYHYKKTGFITEVVVTFTGGKMKYWKPEEVPEFY